MNRHLPMALVAALSACTSDPAAPVNRTFPIRQMDRFFGGDAQTAAPDYTHQPGYAPAYPPLDAP